MGRFFYFYDSDPLVGLFHVRAESEFPNPNFVGFPFESSLVSVVVCHAICCDPAGYVYVLAVPLSWPMLIYIYYAATTIAGIICQSYNVLCVSGPYSVHYAEVYLSSIDFASIRYVWPYSVPLEAFILMTLQHCAVWFDLVLSSDEGRARRKPPSCQVSINQTHRNVHILPGICRTSYTSRTLPSSRLVTCVGGVVKD